MSNPNRIADGNFTVAQPASDLRYSAPIPMVATQYIFEQDFVISRASFTPIAIGTVHPTVSGFYLQQETPPQPTSIKDVVLWTRIYASVPATHSLPSSVSYAFIGFYYTGIESAPGRPQKASVVPARVQYDYFRLDGSTYVSVLDIPIIQEQKYYAVGWSTFDTVALGIEAPGLIGYSQAAPFPQVSYDLTHNSAAAIPTREAYELMVAAGTEIVAVESQLDLWLGFGNIVRRQTTYVRAK